MIRLTFSQFFKGEFTDIGFELYIVKDAEEVMYVGISQVSIWERWFGGFNSHMDAISENKLYGNSRIGEVIARRLPNSWNWIIELWTKEDCRNALVDELGARRTDELPIMDLDALLIRKLAPLYNVMYAAGSHEDPMIRKTLDEAYRKIFEK